MINRHRIAALMVTAMIALFSPAAALAQGTSYSAQAGGTSSAASAYGGQGNGLTPTGGSPSLPFTGLDIGLLVGAGCILFGIGAAARWHLRRGSDRLGN
jgi:hypothetical protein